MNNAQEYLIKSAMDKRAVSPTRRVADLLLRGRGSSFEGFGIREGKTMEQIRMLLDRAVQAGPSLYSWTTKKELPRGTLPFSPSAIADKLTNRLGHQVLMSGSLANSRNRNLSLIGYQHLGNLTPPPISRKLFSNPRGIQGMANTIKFREEGVRR